MKNTKKKSKNNKRRLTRRKRIQCGGLKYMIQCRYCKNKFEAKTASFQLIKDALTHYKMRNNNVVNNPEEVYILPHHECVHANKNRSFTWGYSSKTSSTGTSVYFSGHENVN